MVSEKIATLLGATEHFEKEDWAAMATVLAARLSSAVSNPLIIPAIDVSQLDAWIIEEINNVIKGCPKNRDLREKTRSDANFHTMAFTNGPLPDLAKRMNRYFSEEFLKFLPESPDAPAEIDGTKKAPRQFGTTR